MKEQIAKFFGQILSLWKNLKGVQKVIVIIIAAGVAAGIILLGIFSSSPAMTPLFTAKITDETLLNRISMRIDEEGIPHQITQDGLIYIDNKKDARRMIAILMREDLIPASASPWDVFKMDRWTLTDFERNVNLRRAVTSSLEQHIESLEDIDKAQITLVMPEKELFSEDQNKVSASIILIPAPGSDISSNRKKIEGIVKLVKFAVEGLEDENITITDSEGTILNDFEGLAEFDRLELAKREMKIKAGQEKKMKGEIVKALRQIYGEDRVQIINLDIDLDMGKKTVSTEEHFPITMVPDDPSTPYDESVVEKSITISKNVIDEKFKGTGFNPEGPPGQEGQTPPAYKDLEGMVGEYTRNNVTQNEVINKRNIYEERSPWVIRRITVGVAIDGIWKYEYDEKGKMKLDPAGNIMRSYEPVSDEDISKAKILVEHAVGFSKSRGDSVTVQSVQFDRSKQFSKEDEKYRNMIKIREAIIYFLTGLAIFITLMVAIRLINKAVERKRMIQEEERERRMRRARDLAMQKEEEEGRSIELSVEDRARLEMQENAVNMAREHPEEVAQLIKTWLMEE